MTCSRHYDILAKTRTRMMTAVTFSRQNDAGSRVSNTQHWENLVQVVVLVSESKALYQDVPLQYELGDLHYSQLTQNSKRVIVQKTLTYFEHTFLDIVVMSRTCYHCPDSCNTWKVGTCWKQRRNNTWQPRWCICCSSRYLHKWTRHFLWNEKQI